MVCDIIVDESIQGANGGLDKRKRVKDRLKGESSNETLRQLNAEKTGPNKKKGSEKPHMQDKPM